MYKSNNIFQNKSLILFFLIFIFTFHNSPVHSREYSKDELIEKRQQIVEASIKQADLKKYKLACKILKKSIEIFKGDERVYIYYGLFLFKDKKYKQSIKMLEKAVKILDMNISVHYIIAKSLWMLGKRNMAISQMRRVARKMPKHRGVWIDLGDIERELKHFNVARIYYQIGGRYSTDNYGLIKGLIACEEIIGISELSKINYEEYLKYDEKNLPVIKNLIKLYLSTGKYKKAKKLLSNIPKKDEEYMPLLFNILKGEKKFKLLLKYSVKYLKKNPKNIVALTGLMEANLNLKDYIKVIMVASRILKIEPSNVNALVSKAFAVTNVGKFKTAKLLYEKALFYSNDNFKPKIKKNLELINNILINIKKKK